jgi:hypothetical protein
MQGNFMFLIAMGIASANHVYISPLFWTLAVVITVLRSIAITTSTIKEAINKETK